MPKIDEYTINRIKTAANIVDVVGEFVDLKKRGVRYVGLCPFHTERHLGSFVVYPKANCYKCFTCDAKGGPVDFLMHHLNMTFVDAIRWLGNRYGIYTDMTDYKTTQPVKIVKAEPLPMLTLPMAMVESREALDGDTLVAWLRNGINWDSCQRSRIDQVLRDYHVGHARQGHTIWWQIDERQQVRTGKMMLYKADGHRDRTPGKYTFDWIHAALYRDQRLSQYDETKMEMRQTLFGMHLLNRYKTTTRQQVCIVESEKTAVIMAIAYGNNPMQVWMACGGLENINRERLAPIISQARDIVLYPDRDGVDRWMKKAAALNYPHLYVDTDPVTKWWAARDGEKADIADVVIRMLGERRTYKTIEDVIQDMPIIKHMTEELDLRIINDDNE